MGTSESIEADEEFKKCVNNALCKENREKFIRFIAVQPWLDAVSSLMIFKECPGSVYVAGAVEWQNAGRKIKDECSKKPIKVALPYMKMINRGQVSNNTSVKEKGLVLYGRFPSYSFGYKTAYMYDYTQTEGQMDNDIENMPERPKFDRIIRKEGIISLEYTSDELYLRHLFSYFDRENEEEEVLYIREGLSEKQECSEILKAWLDYKFDVVLNYGYITTGERKHYKKNVINAVNAALLVRYRIGDRLQELMFFNEIENQSKKEQMKFLEDVFVLFRSIIDECEGKKTFSLNETVILRNITPALILYSSAKNKEEGKTMLKIFLQKINIECSADENKTEYRHMIMGIHDKISKMKDEEYDELLNKAIGLNITVYPRFYYVGALGKGITNG